MADHQHNPAPPGPRGLPLIGSLRDYQRDPLHLFVTSADRYGDVVRFNMAGKPVVLVSRPELVGHVLQNLEGYPKSRNYDILKDLLGEGLLTSQGETWRAHRKMVQRPLAKARITAFYDQIRDCALDQIETWLRRDPDQVVDLVAETTLLTQVIVGRCFFGIDLSDRAAELADSLAFCMDYVNGRMEALFLLPKELPTPRRRKFERARATLDRAIFDMISRRRGEPTQQSDLLGLLMARGEEGLLSDQELRDELLTMFGAGHETTATAMAWTLYLLSLYPEVEESIVAELAREVGDEQLTPDHVDRLSYLDAVIHESMRVYPPVWSVSRTCLHGDTMAGYAIEPGTMVVISPYVLHRRRDVWPNPEGFDPRRWIGDAARQRPRYAYLPFGGGPRICVGNFFSLLELRVCLAEILRKFKVELLARTQVEPQAGITLRPRRGIPVKLVRRPS